MIYKHMYWDLSYVGPQFPNGVNRFILGLADHSYSLPSVYLLRPDLKNSPFHLLLQKCPGTIQFIAPPNWLPWRRRWDQLLPEPGILFAPGNHYRPCLWPIVLAVHDLIPFELPYYARFQRCSPATYAQMLANAQKVLCVSKFTEQRVQAFQPQAKTSVIGEGLFPEPAPQRPAWAPAWPYYLFVGNAEPRKCMEDAIAFASHLHDAGLIIIGGNFGRRRQVSSLLQDWTGAKPALHFSSCTDAELTWLYQHTRALLFPSQYEGFGLPALECLRAGRPVIARPIGAMREHLHEHAIWHDAWHDAAPITSPTNQEPGTIAHPIRVAIDNWKSSSALQHYLAQFRWATAQAHLENVIQEITAP